MRAARALLAALALLLPAACDEGQSEDATYCLVQAHCNEVSIEGGKCCDGVCVDCYVDSDSDGTSDCADPDYLDGACLAD